MKLCYGSQKGSVAQDGIIRHPDQFAMKRRSRTLKRKGVERDMGLGLIGFLDVSWGLIAATVNTFRSRHHRRPTPFGFSKPC